jgi:AhpD family alkylhydroperoxidase
MKPRLNPFEVAPDAIQAMQVLGAYVAKCGLEPGLLHLAQMRASQMNGCAICLDMHSREARDRGEQEHRLYLLNAWREAPFYTEWERAALAWTEALTDIAGRHAPDDVYAELSKHFSAADIVRLSTAVAVINAFNRLAIGFRAVPGAMAQQSEMRSAA